jgi:hypothetical protein
MERVDTYWIHGWGRDPRQIGTALETSNCIRMRVRRCADCSPARYGWRWPHHSRRSGDIDLANVGRHPLDSDPVDSNTTAGHDPVRQAAGVRGLTSGWPQHPTYGIGCEFGFTFFGLLTNQSAIDYSAIADADVAPKKRRCLFTLIGWFLTEFNAKRGRFRVALSLMPSHWTRRRKLVKRATRCQKSQSDQPP